MRSKKGALAVIISGLISALSASLSPAATISAKFNGANNETDIHFALHDVYVNPALDATAYGAVGRYSWTGVSGNIAPLAENFHTFCIDFVQDIVPNTTYTYDITELEPAPLSDPNYFLNPPGGMGTVKANAIRELWGLYYAGLDTNAKVAGFQIAIWKILYESTGSLDVLTGDFQVAPPDRSPVAPSFVTFANDYLAGISNGLGGYKTDHLAPNLKALASPTFQDQLIQLVPLPPAVYGGALLISVAGAMSFRRSRAQIT